MRLSMRLRILDPLFEDLLRFFNKLPMQIDRIRLDASVGVILAEDELRRLAVVFLHFATVRFALLGEFLGHGAVAAGVGFLGLHRVSSTGGAH